MLDDVPAGTDDNGRDTVFFKMSGCQTHGLMAYRSQGDEEGGVSTVCDQAAEDFWSVVLNRLPMAIIGRYTVKMLGQTSDYTVFAKSCKRIDRQIAFPVPRVSSVLVPGEILVV